MLWCASTVAHPLMPQGSDPHCESSVFARCDADAVPRGCVYGLHQAQLVQALAAPEQRSKAPKKPGTAGPAWDASIDNPTYYTISPSDPVCAAQPTSHAEHHSNAPAIRRYDGLMVLEVSGMCGPRLRPLPTNPSHHVTITLLDRRP
jgi:hypothetical protein